MANENFYMVIDYMRKSAVLLVTSEGQWSLRYEDPGFNFEKYGGRHGTFRMPFGSESMYEFYFEGTTEPARFKMSGVTFPPRIIMEPRFLENQFHVGEDWAKALGFTSGYEASRAYRGHWYVVAYGPTVAWIKQYCEDRVKELKALAKTLGLNLAALVDPTGLLSAAAAIDASEHGDYLGCALNLLACIPGIGKAAQAGRDAQIVQRIEVLTREVTILTKWLQESKAILSRTSLQLAGLAGTTKAVAARVTTAVKLLVNRNWIHKLDPKDYVPLGLLAREVEVLHNLARQGFYFVVRACNPERVRWLSWAASNGVRTLSKPLWIKAKSLKAGGYLKGLVGYRLDPGMHPSLLAKLARKVTPPAGFNPRWLECGNGKIAAVYKIDSRGHAAFGLTDAAKTSDHYLVETDGFLILCDARGSAYVSDLDVVLIQKRLGSGAYGPPGMHVGPGNITYRGGDNAALQPYWNQQFSRVQYPPGYQCIQHGEATGTAGNFKPINGSFDPSMDVRTTIWSPGDAWESERLIVAAQAEHLPNGVGYARNWDDLVHFHHANPMGEFRITH
jgi:hypothetical protein